MHEVTLRPAVASDVYWLELWDTDEGVIACTTDDENAVVAFKDADWAEELAMQSDVFRYYIAEVGGRAIGAMLIIDPLLEPNHYWGEIPPHHRAVDIWIGSATDRGRGYGTRMMELALEICFGDERVTKVVIDPLTSNTDAHRFYRRLGFEPIGRRRFGDDDCLVHELTRETWRRYRRSNANDPES